MKLGAFFLTMLLLQSCAKISFQSNNITPSYISTKPKHSHRISLVGVRDFYLWGLIPNQHVVNLSEVLSAGGLITGAGLTVEDYQTFEDKVWSVVTLGLYLPRHYRVKAWGQLQGSEE